MFEFHSSMQDIEDDCFDQERVLSRKALSGESDEPQLRPRRWAEYFGQEKVKANLTIAIEAARGRREALDHILLYGPPGLGKTTLAGIIAHEMGVEMRITSGPAIERQGDLAAILTNLQENDVLFIDEIHRLNRTVEEILYPAMEDYALDILIGKGPSARSIRLDLPRFTLIGATTRAGLLTSPLRDRFGMIQRLDLYAPSEISLILCRYASLLGVGIDQDGLDELSTRCRGTPRVAIRLLRRMRDYAQVHGNNLVNRAICDMGLSALEIDPIGLDGNDRLIMRVMAEMYDGGPVGLDTLAASTGEDPVTIEDIYEPYLMQIGFIAKTPRGRILTRGGFSHLGLPFVDARTKKAGDPGQVSLQEILEADGSS
ncbi:MAG: Holliday junction branch migration DNA helicase RuvB [Saccharofermentanales bacterium]